MMSWLKSLFVLVVLLSSAELLAGSEDPRERAIVFKEPPVVVDSDGDGIPDECDRCPNTPVGDRVDSFGCSIFEEDQVILEIDILFDFDKAIVKPQYLSQVQELADYLKRFIHTKVTIAGHTDDRGSYAYNQRLSERRAQAVADLLSERYGIEAKRIKTVGYGKTQPRATGTSDEVRARNRRIEAIVEPLD